MMATGGVSADLIGDEDNVSISAKQEDDATSTTKLQKPKKRAKTGCLSRSNHT